MIKFIDNRLNAITMYRLILYYLIILLGIAAIFSALGLLPFSSQTLIVSTLFITAICWIANGVLAHTFRVPANVESVYISALILALIITPAETTHDLWFLVWAAVLAMASKYILAINRKHVFNPVALAVAITALTINQSATWWVGNAPMLAFVLIGGLLIVRKTRRFQMVFSFLIVAMVTTLTLTILNGSNLILTIQETAVSSPLIFFAAVILTEPLTTPPTRTTQIIYGGFVGLLFSPQFHIGAFYTTPELAILMGNVFSYLVSPKAKLILRLKDRIQTAPDTFDFIFTPNRKLSFAPGQYMEWTLGHDHPDSRGNRRYFTLASSPTERDLILGVKFYRNSSSYKQSMLEMDRDSEIVAAQLTGDFVLPRDPKQRLVFIAGGIGITPFRSMIKYLLDTKQKRSITLFYANRTANEIVYKDVFDRAQHELGIRTIYTLTDTNNIPAGWRGKTGYISAKMIKDEVPYYRNCVYYLSGPNSMVTSFEEALLKLGVAKDHIKTDFFPGFA
ncbi:MAG: RnfABCDGE type electron transport complex subunit D [Chloroflexota bacterium]